MTETKSYRKLGATMAFIWALFCMFPLWWVLTTAFKMPTDVNQGARYLPWIDFTPSLHAFKDAFSGIRGDFVDPIVSSIIISISSTFLAVLLGTMAAYALVRYSFKIRLLSGAIFGVISIGGFVWLNSGMGVGVVPSLFITLIAALGASIFANRFDLPGPVLGNNDVTFWFVSQRMFPPIVTAFAIYLLYAEMGKAGIRLLDSYWGLVIVYTVFGLPFAVWLMRDFLSSLPIEVEEAAQVDGISTWRIFFQIVLPMSGTGLIATSIIVLTFIWNEFLLALFLTSSRWQTLPILLAGQNSSRGDEWWAISVAALISIVPMVIVAILLGRMMKSGVLSGSIK